jgi:hypothetical protein
MGSAVPVARRAGSSFDLMFVDETGCRRREPLSSCWDRPFERVLPVRTFPAIRDVVNWPGYWWSATNGGHVGYESWVERDVAMMLDFDRAPIARRHSRQRPDGPHAAGHNASSQVSQPLRHGSP